MVSFLGKFVAYHCGLRRIVESAFDAVEAQDAADRGYVEGVVAKRDADRAVEPCRDRGDGGRTGRLERHRIDLARFRRAYEQRAPGSQRHFARVRHACDELDRESRRQLDLVERKIVAPRQGRAQNQESCDRQSQAAHRRISLRQSLPGMPRSSRLQFTSD